MRRAPAHLSSEMAGLWRHVLRTWTLDEHHVMILTQTCTAWDRAQEARRALEKDGLVVAGPRGGYAAHPGVAIERASMAEFRHGLKALNLDDDVDPTRPASRARG